METLTIALYVAGYLALMALSVALGAMFCGLETGIYVLNKVRLELRCEQGRRDAMRLRSLLSSPHSLLATLLIGTNIAGYLTTFAASGLFLLLAHTGARTEYYTIALTTPLLFIFAESVPKNVFHQLSERLTYRFSWFLGGAALLFRWTGIVPLVRGFSAGLTRLIPGAPDAAPLANAGIAAALAESRATGLLTHAQLAMADRIMSISEVALRDAMQPWSRVVHARHDIGREELSRLFRAHNISRVPLTDDGRVVGICDMYRALIDTEAHPPRAYMTSALMLDENAPVIDAILTMQRENVVMAIVTDSDAPQRPIGMVTLKDLVEPIVGELRAW